VHAMITPASADAGSIAHPSLEELPAPPLERTGWPWTEESPQLPATMPDGSHWPRISIVTPSYNQGQFLEETIRSVLLQGYPNLEYMIMDGGSTDESVAIMRKYEPWLAYWVSQPDDGQAAAIAEGFRRATGEILAWINSDDRYLPGAFARVGRFFARHPKLVFGSGDVEMIDCQGKRVRRLYAARPSAFLTANLGLHKWPQQGCFWTELSYDQVGGVDPALRFCMDRDLFIRLARDGPNRRVPGPPLASFREHPTAKSSTMLETASQEDAILIARYSDPKWSVHPRLIRWLWRAWVIPVAVRARLNRHLGWEY